MSEDSKLKWLKNKRLRRVAFRMGRFVGIALLAYCACYTVIHMTVPNKNLGTGFARSDDFERVKARGDSTAAVLIQTELALSDVAQKVEALSRDVDSQLRRVPVQPEDVVLVGDLRREFLNLRSDVDRTLSLYRNASAVLQNLAEQMPEGKIYASHLHELRTEVELGLADSRRQHASLQLYIDARLKDWNDTVRMIEALLALIGTALLGLFWMVYQHAVRPSDKMHEAEIVGIKHDQ